MGHGGEGPKPQPKQRHSSESLTTWARRRASEMKMSPYRRVFFWSVHPLRPRNCAFIPRKRPVSGTNKYVIEKDARAVRAVHHAVHARCGHFPCARTTFSFPLCCFLHLTTICPSLVVSPCAVAAG